MAYIKNTWKNQNVERPRTYSVINNQDGSITLADSFGTITEAGTPVNATNMNHIEDGVAGCAIRKHNLTETFNLGEWVLGGTADNEGIYKSLVTNNIGNAVTDSTKWKKVEMGGGEGGSSRNIGEIVASTVPLTDAGLHLLDGALIQGSGIYADFVSYISSLYKEEEVTWVQPHLTSNTSYGTVSSTSLYSTYPPYPAFNGIVGGGDKYISNSTSGGNLTWELPIPIKMASCKVYQTGEASYLNRFPSSIALQGSNDGSTWENIGSASDYSQPTSENYIEVTVTNPTYYKYYKWTFGANFGGNTGIAVSEIKIDAVYIRRTEYFCTEAEWQQSVTNYGVCGKFVYDSVNNTVRLPKVTGIIEGTTDLNALGDLVEAGLPDHTHTLTVGANAGSSWPSTYKAAWGNDDQYRDANKSSATTNSASACNPIYGNSDTVQPQTIKALYYIVIATSTKTNIQVDIDEIATDLNSKADVDLSNTTPSQSFINSVKSWTNFLPDYSRAVTVYNSSGGGSYTVDWTGWLAFDLYCNQNSAKFQIYVDGVMVGATASDEGDRAAGIVMVKSGSVVTWNGSQGIVLKKVPFVEN